jgi:phospholipid/cholesterol/gamma-HCH transport system substrate-binding protein
MADAKPQPKTHDERIYRKGNPPHRQRNALIILVLILIGTYLAATKEIPFKHEYEVKAVFTNAANIRKSSPVRIAGVNVGEVKSVERMGDNAEVTFTVKDEGRPIRDDAQVEIRPRIFLEGNFFLDVKPGSPSADELDDGGTIPVSQTSTAVQLDQILTSLQAPDRENLQKLLRGYGTALNHEPTAAEDRGQDPSTYGETGAQSVNDSFKYGPSASRDSAIVNEALQGTEPHDLSKLIAANAQVFDALVQREQQLADLVTNFNVTAGAFASESTNLSETVRLLAPTLENATPALRNTNATFPYLRAFARDIQPGIEELPATIAASPAWLKQAKGLMSQNELKRTSYQLKLTGPPAGRAAAATPGFFTQTELLSRCVSNVLIPTGNITINDAFSTNVPNYKEFMYAAAGFAGESQVFDGNGPFLRFQTGGGPNLVHSEQPGGGFENSQIFGKAFSPPLGSQPVMGNKPPYRTDVPCQDSAVPDLNGPAGAVGPASPAP